MGQYTVQLVDTKFGRIVLDPVAAATSTAAAAAAVAGPPISGDTTGAFVAGTTVDQAQVLKVSGTDVAGNPVTSPTQLPPNPETVAPSQDF